MSPRRDVARLTSTVRPAVARSDGRAARAVLMGGVGLGVSADRLLWEEPMGPGPEELAVSSVLLIPVGATIGLNVNRRYER